MSSGDDTFADYESADDDFDPATILQGVAKVAARKRKAVAKQPLAKIPRLGQFHPAPRPRAPELVDSDDEEEPSTVNKALLRRVQQLESMAAQAATAVDYKKKYEALLASSSGSVSTIVPSEPPPQANMIRGSWVEEGKAPVPIRDNGMSTL